MRPKRPSAILKASETPAFLVGNLVNIRFLTGRLQFRHPSHRQNGMTLFTDGRDLETAAHAVHRGVSVRDTATLGDAMKKVRSCGIEDTDLSLDRYRRWKSKFKNTKFIHIRRGRRVPARERQRRSSEIPPCAVHHPRDDPQSSVAPEAPHPRNRSRVAAAALGTGTWSAGDGVRSLESRSNEHQPSPSPSGVAHPQKGHIVQIDCGARYSGYCADQSAVFSPANRRRCRRKSVRGGGGSERMQPSRRSKPGVSVRHLDQVAREVLKRYKFEQYFCHALGHGVGSRSMRASRSRKKAPDQKLLRGEIITIEPGCDLPGRFGDAGGGGDYCRSLIAVLLNVRKRMLTIQQYSTRHVM